MHANEKEGWFAVKKLLLTAGIALTVLLLLGILAVRNAAALNPLVA